MVLPEGTVVPPLPHLLVLIVAAATVGGLLWRERPTVTEGVVLALAPWMVVGASLHVLYQIDAAPAAVGPFLGSPAVYLSTAVVAGSIWLLARRLTGTAVPSPPSSTASSTTTPTSIASPDATSTAAPGTKTLGGVGVALMIAAIGTTLAVGGIERFVVPSGALLTGVVLGVVAWWLLGFVRSDERAASGYVGLLVFLAHALDGVSTAAGVDLLGFGERTPASRAILDLAAVLPIAEVLGVGWLFVLVKVAVAAIVVVVFAEYVREEPTPGYAILGLLAAVGLGPGTHNLLLFTVAS